jgi:hypothetical protein
LPGAVPEEGPFSGGVADAEGDAFSQPVLCSDGGCATATPETNASASISVAGKSNRFLCIIVGPLAWWKSNLKPPAEFQRQLQDERRLSDLRIVYCVAA